MSVLTVLQLSSWIEAGLTFRATKSTILVTFFACVLAR